MTATISIDVPKNLLLKANGGQGQVYANAQRAKVCPACAGMIRPPRPRPYCARCLPRMRGDDPNLETDGDADERFAPHARG